MAIYNTKRTKTTKYDKSFKHKSFGIQKWLCSKGFCLKENHKHIVDKEEYKQLLREFYTFITGLDKFKNVEPEEFVQANFNKFCSFCVKRYKK